MPKLAVYDAENKARLLGFLHVTRDYPGEVVNFAALKQVPVTCCPLDDCRAISMRTSTVSFRKVWIHNTEEVASSPWFREQRRLSKVILTTSAPLSLLQCIREFCLPDLDDPETEGAEKDGREVERNAAFY